MTFLIMDYFNFICQMKCVYLATRSSNDPSVLLFLIERNDFNAGADHNLNALIVITSRFTKESSVNGV